jgi:hypothetical protein
MPVVELQIFLSILVTDSPHLGRARNAPLSTDNPRGNRFTKNRPSDNPDVDGSKRQRGNGSGRGRGRGNRVGRGQYSTNTDRVDFCAIAGVLTPNERKRHQEEGLCFKCHKEGHRLFQCPELKGRKAVDTSSKPN